MMNNIPTQLGNYHIIQLLGHGGFADVYLGEHVYLRTRAAIKMIHTRLDPPTIESFRNEALLIAHLGHPNIIRVLDFGVEDAVPFLVLEFASGGTLRQRAPRGTRLAPMVFMPYVHQVAAALQYAHDQKVIHRDIKPENMLLGADELVKLSDFGIAQISQSTQSQKTDENALGTMMYMAPEQLQGKARPASDQYALAVVAYEWLTGEKPFKGSNMEIMAQHLSAPPPPINEQALSVPHAVTQVLWKALAKDPRERFARVQDFADALERAFRMREPIVVAPQFAEKGPPPLAAKRPEPAPRQQAVQQGISSAPTKAPASTPPVRKEKSLIAKTSSYVGRLLLALLLFPLLLCGLSAAGYSYLSSIHSPAEADTMATSFLNSLSYQNYDQSYSDLSSSVTGSTSHNQFVQTAQSEDRCDGQVTKYQQTSVSSSDRSRFYNYLVSRSKLSSAYHLHLTISKDFWGNWHISDYGSDVKTCS